MAAEFMRIATWNVNSVRQRVDNLVAWLAERQPDVVCLQEIKCEDHAFPREPFERLGYNIAVHGQKTFHGVALLSKYPFDEVTPRLGGDTEDAQARFLEACISTKTGVDRVISLYLPNCNPVTTEKYTYKLKWMDRLIAFSLERLKLEEPVLLCGDFNVIPAAVDARRPAAWVDDALFLPTTREKFRALTQLGLTDAIRTVNDSDDLYTFWDYTAGAWQKNDGIRIDHILMSPQAADRLQAAGIDKHVRGWEKPSDHVPVYVDLDIESR
jgi:exodeoxyribonuclease-3